MHRGTAWVCKSGCGRVCVHVSSGAAPFWLDSFLPLFVFGSAAALEASGPSHQGGAVFRDGARSQCAFIWSALHPPASRAAATAQAAGLGSAA